MEENHGENQLSKNEDYLRQVLVNDIKKADIHDENTVTCVFDNHKFGDFNPYIYMSENKGLHGKKLLVISQITHYYGG